MEENTNPFSENIEVNEDTKETKEEEKQEEQANEQNVEQDVESQGEQQIEQPSLEEKYEELNKKYIRLAADFDNFRKRTQQEKDELSKFTTAGVLRKLTYVADNFERAKTHLEGIDDVKALKDGFEAVYKQFADTLDKLGLSEIECLGHAFNPNLHEAVTQVETDEFEPDMVALVVQKGYQYQDKVVRPAMVGVAKKKENE
ncbi:nucleotide exchange factor GrpE [bacterium]|nr:nucleotide exchange factor GrpE [bacterium]